MKGSQKKMVWLLLQPKDFVYGQSFARLSYRFFLKKKFSPQNAYSTVKPPAKKIQKKLELEKTFFPHYTLSLVSKSSAHAFYIMIQFLQSLLDDADAVFCCILLDVKNAACKLT